MGDTIAGSVYAFLRDEANIDRVERLAAAGVQMEVEQKALASQRLEGQSVVVSGTFSRHSRDEYKQLIEAHGGKNVGSISKKTAFILAGEAMGPSKREKAEKLGIPLVSEEDFLKILGEE